MTDTLDAEASSASLACDQEGCEQTFDTAQQLGYHRWRAHGIKKAAAPKRTKRDRPPATVKIQVGPEKATTAKSDAATKARIEQLVSMICGGLAMAGQAQDAADIMRGREQLALAVVELAKYEPWLRRLLAGGEATGRVMAWVTLGLTVLMMAIPILDRHGALPQELRPMALSLVGQVPTPPPAGDVSEPVAA